jgi:hypothetical protein
VVPTLVKDAGAIGDALTAIKELAEKTVGLKPLELFVRIQVRVLIVESYHHA